MKKIKIITWTIILLMLTTSAISADNKIEGTEIRMDKISVMIPYSENEVDIKREENFQEVKIKIIDSNSGELIKIIGEIKSSTKSNFNKTIYEEYNTAGCKSRLYADFLMYSSGSFSEILGVTNTRWVEASSGGWTLENKHSNYTRMSTNRFEIYGDATITVSSTSTIGGSIGYTGFENLNFSLSGSKTGSWHARKIINGGFVYSI